MGAYADRRDETEEGTERARLEDGIQELLGELQELIRMLGAAFQ